MSDLTREQIEELQRLGAKFAELQPLPLRAVHRHSSFWRIEDTENETLTDLDGDFFQVQAEYIAAAINLLPALATEVLAQRERRCGDCRHWADAWVTSGAAGWCQGPSPCPRNATTPDYFCANWAAKEGA